MTLKITKRRDGWYVTRLPLGLEDSGPFPAESLALEYRSWLEREHLPRLQITATFVCQLMRIVQRADDKFNAFSWRTFGHQVTAIGQAVFNAGGDQLMREVLLALEERLEREFPGEADSLIGSLDHQWDGIGNWTC